MTFVNEALMPALFVGAVVVIVLDVIDKVSRS